MNAVTAQLTLPAARGMAFARRQPSLLTAMRPWLPLPTAMLPWLPRPLATASRQCLPTAMLPQWSLQMIMQAHARLGRSRSLATLRCPGLGGGIFDGTAEEVVLSSVMQGYRLIDTAANYGTEAAIGRALKRSGVPREECFLVSKALTGGYEKTVESFRRSLASLDTPYLDAFLMHGAAATGVRDLRSPEHARARLETWRAMRDLRCEGGPPYRGCARAIGVCNHSPRQVERLMEVAKPAIHQIEFTPLLQRNATLAQCAAHGIVCQG